MQQARPQLFITSPFGPRIHPVTKEQQFHNGIDIGLPEGHPVKAPIPGHAYHKIDDINGNGLIVVAHLGGVEWRIGYSHLRDPGTQGPVQAGQVIGYIGKTGRTNGRPHLHLTVRRNGEAVDPLKFMDWRAFQLMLSQGGVWTPFN